VEPEHEDVFVYLKLQHKNYEETRAFIRDYWYWRDRLWQTQKWFHYLLGDLSYKTHHDRFRYCVGDKLLEWLSPNDYPASLAEIRKTLKAS
jgi:hypothetical protein